MITTARPLLRICLRVALALALGAGVLVPLRAAETDEPGSSQPPVRFAFSKQMFAEVNETDAKAAVKTYAQIIAGVNGLLFDASQQVLDGTNAIADALRNDRMDLLSITTDEFLALEDLGLVGPFVASVANGVFAEEFVLLTRTDSGLQDVRDLKRRSLILLNDPRASLAGLWLDVTCREQGLGPANQALARVTPVAKALRAVLPVFFRQADACVVTRNGWNVMGELNPQVLKQLRVLAVSQPLVPVVTCFRRGFSEPLKQRVIAASLSAYDRPAFKQLMVMFKTERLGQPPDTCLDSARALLARHRQLCASTNGAAGRVPSSDPVREGGVK